jgi:trigger factor
VLLLKRIITKEDLNAKREIEVLIPREKFNSAFERVAKEYQKRAHIKGFRPGKAPLEIVKLQFGNEIREEARDLVIREEIWESVKSQGLEPVSKIHVTNEEETEEGFKVRAKFEVMPHFEFPNIQSLKVKKVIKRVSEGDVEKEIEAMKKRLAEYIPVEREAREGDYIFVDFEERDKGGRVLNVKKNVYIPLIWNEIDPTLYEALKGRKKGDIVTLERKLAVEGGEPLPRIYVYKILSVREEVLPGLEEVAKLVGYKDTEELKEKIREELSEKMKKESEEDFEWAIINTLYDGIQFELPESLVEEEFQLLKDSLPQLAAMPDGERVLRKAAEDRVKREIILNRFAERENIEVTEEEVEREIKERAKELKVSPSEYKEYLRKRGGIEGVKGIVKRKKAMDILKSLVNMEVIFE